MPDIAALTNRDLEEPLEDASLREAVVITDPADTTEEVWVVCPGFADEIKFGPCPWSPRIVDEGTYGIPSKGDRALVAVSDDDVPWIVEWWPDAS